MPSRIIQAPLPPTPLHSSSSASKQLKHEQPMTPRSDVEVGSPSSSAATTITMTRRRSSNVDGAEMYMTPVANGLVIDHDDEDDPMPATGKITNLGDGSAVAVDAGDEDSEFESSDDEDEEEASQDVHVEVRLLPGAKIMPSLIQCNIPAMLRSSFDWIEPASVVPERFWTDIVMLRENVERIYVAECGDSDSSIYAPDAEYRVHVYQTFERSENLGGGLDDDEEDENTSPATVHELPCTSFEGLWDNLIYDDDIKPRLLRYISSSMLFSDSEIDRNIISWNRMVLLHGPPGTGKTSFCRALAQKLAVRMSETFPSGGRLVEINSHSLFSKWFSESGKLVHKLFEDVTAMVEDESCLVIVMIDEVESLTSSREASNEPSDALRVVNALLTQLDKLRSYKNVLVMTTSNLASKIDTAFLDRADVKQYVGLPPAQAIYWILSSCLRELGRSGLANGADKLLTWPELMRTGGRSLSSKRAERGRLSSERLAALSKLCKEYGFSGRFLRKVPLMAHAKYLQGSTARIDKWVNALERAVQDELASRRMLSGANSQD